MVTKIDTISTRILDLPTIRGHVLSMATMVQQSIVLVQIQFSDGSIGLGEGTAIGGLSYGPESPESIQSAIDKGLRCNQGGSDASSATLATSQTRRIMKPIR